MEKIYQPFETLQIWQEGMQICYSVYDQLKECRDFGLRNQMERSAVSISSNIAEGYELNSDRGFIKHLYIAKGSNGELRTQIKIAIHLNYFSSQSGEELLSRCTILSGMIQKFINERKKRMIERVIKSIITYFGLCSLAPLLL